MLLHVDDDPSLLDMVATFLKHEDDRIEVETATNPEDGLEMLTDHDVDCIVSDYDMPHQNGIEFLEAIREEYPDLPFILYTGKGSEEVAADAISAGVSDYLQKEAGTDQYRVLANRITNLVSQFRAETRVEQYAEAQAESERYRQQLLELMSDPSRSDDEKIDRLLALGCERLGVENGHLVMIDNVAGKHDVIGVYGSDVVREGVTDLSTTYCRKTIESDDILDVHHAGGQGWDGDPAYEMFELECYIGGKLTVDDTLFGTLCFVDSEPREPFTHNEKAFFNLLLQWCNQMVERRRRLNQAEAIFEHAQDAIFLIEVNNEETFRIRSVNRAYEEMTGLSTAELRGQTPRELLGDEQGGEVEARFQECVTKHTPIEYEEQLTLNGQTADFQTRLAPVIQEETVVQLVGATRDITERKQREQRYNAIFNQTYQFTGLLEPDGTLIEANQTALNFGGLDREDVIGKKMWQAEWFQHSDETEERARQAVERAANGEFVRQELSVRGADREAIIDFSVRPITDNQGNVTQLVPEGRDITERKEREQELQRYQRIVEDLDDIATIIDPDGTISYVSPSVRRVLGYEPQELIGENGFNYQPAETSEAVGAAIEYVLDNPDETQTVQTRFRRADGSWCWIESTVRNRLDEEMSNGILVSSRDITERKRHVEQLNRQNDRLAEFASVVSHDLRNPLNVAEAGLELAREECDSDHLENVDRALDRMNALIKDILTLAREGETVTDLESVDLTAIAEGCWVNVETADATLVIDLDRTIYADESRLKQVFENLVRNAVKHGDDVTVTIGELEDGFYVEDDGPGIPEDKRDDVLDTGYSTSDQGTGFGLSIVKQIVNAHGWEIHVTEGSEGGARFEITGVEFTNE